MSPTKPTMQERAFYDDLISQYIQEQPDDIGAFTVSHLRLFHGGPLNGTRVSGHLRRLIRILNRGGLPFVILREQRVRKGSDVYTVFHYAKKTPGKRMSPWELQEPSSIPRLGAR